MDLVNGSYRCPGTYVLGNDANTQNTAQVASATLAIANGLEGVVNSVYKGIVDCKLQTHESLAKLHAELVKESAEKVKSLPKEVQEKIRVIDIQLKQWPLYQGNESRSATWIKRRELIYLQWPGKPEDIFDMNFHITREKQEQTKLNVNKILSQHPEHQDDPQVLVDKIRDNSSEAIDDPKRVQIFLYGPAGTGKTIFAKYLAKELGLYPCEVSPKDLTDGLVGKEQSFSMWSEAGDDKFLGKLGECFRRAGLRRTVPWHCCTVFPYQWSILQMPFEAVIIMRVHCKR